MKMKRKDENGSALAILPVSLIVAVGMVIASLTMSTSNVTSTYRETRKMQAYYVAKAGIERQVFDLKLLTKTAVLVDPFKGIEDFHNKKTYDNGTQLKPFPAPPLQEALLGPGGQPVLAGTELLNNGIVLPGTFDVSLRIEGYDDANPGAMSSSRRFVTIRSTGWVPSKTAINAVHHTIETTILVELSSSEVFDYSYFVNNWGWFYGNTIESNGNVRSNGQFDSGGYSPAVNGSPRYLGANGSDLYGYLDDNDDGVKDGSDGGIYAGWDIVGSQNVEGMGGQNDGSEFVNQHEFDGNIEMPNLTDLTLYEQHGIATGSSVTIGSVQLTDAVFGDDPGESGNLVLFGTPANPIEITGTVVVRGSLIIKGTVSGQGVIYAGGNVYVADDLNYANPPTTTRPAGTSEGDFESWLQNNQSADSLGLFAREHVVLGDYTNSSWRLYVNNWMNSSLNKSAEDAGEDGIPNTAAGIDGLYGTSDDDLLEGDNNWSVDTYSTLHESLGQIPSGSVIGDVIPGTGEDIDGDGVFDGHFSMSEFDLPETLNSGKWGGNLPSGASSYGQIATRYISNFDAAMYTNHALAGLIFAPNDTINFNGCIVSRNEAIVYGANGMNVNHDVRLIGGGDNFGYYLPRTFKDIRFMKTWDSVATIHWDELALQNQAQEGSLNQ
ncbi:MAG: hypothetical protein ACI97A_001537 [Planctomycetota bacterium]|jgi:hypothetical protein